MLKHISICDMRRICKCALVNWNDWKCMTFHILISANRKNQHNFKTILKCFNINELIVFSSGYMCSVEKLHEGIKRLTRPKERVLSFALCVFYRFIENHLYCWTIRNKYNTFESRYYMLHFWSILNIIKITFMFENSISLLRTFFIA